MDHSRVVVVVMLVATVAVGAGAPMVEQSSSLEQFQTDSPEAEALDYIESNFTTGEENTTTVQIIVTGDDVLGRESLIDQLEYQQTLRSDPTVNATLVEDRPTTGIANLVAVAAIRQDGAAEVRATAAELERLNRSVAEERRAVERRNVSLAATAGTLRAGLTTLRQDPNQSIDRTFESVQADTPVALNATDRETFRTAAQRLRDATDESTVRAAYRLGTEGVLADDYAALRQRGETLRADAARLESLAAELKRQRSRLENATDATLTEQRDAVAALNESEREATLGRVLDDEGGPGAVFMPTAESDLYEAGATSAEATVLFVTQRSTETTGQGAASDELIDAQLQIQALGDDSDLNTVVFGAGIIADEIDGSLGDSVAIVGPLALLFVFITLTVAYRDVLDIVLGLIGIVVVLVWTFGFMGWANVDFNQILISVPVLLIGLSIDYAIHVFMRHREQRTEEDATAGPRGSMRVALTGVGVALIYVTATTTIGFLSNLTSPVGPIRDFGVASSFGIFAALLVFTLLIPALKVEIDEVLEGRGVDRRKRAFGTGGGAFSSVLSIGAGGARRGPAAVIVVALVISAGGVFGASQVDTAFEQEDFIADDPPDALKELPEPFAPGDYTAKRNLDFVNDNFVREGSQAQVLVEGDLTRAETLQRLDATTAVAADQEVTQTVAGGEADITSPLSVMRSVAAENESFAAALEASDTDGDGVPDRNLEAVYDELFAVAPDEAASVVDREDGDYVAARLVVTVDGGASTADVTEQMRTVAAEADGDGYTATATGTAVINTIVQDDLLSTVIDSLIVSLVATALFLMLAYRVTEGSASLGAVTITPVILSVTWILGTMFLLGIPFNVLTGTITSLTIGLGVAYSIHLSERYTLELERTGEVWTAMDRAVTGTGGALLGSAATTVGGFGTLALAILPPLQQFGIITGLTIVYAFLASVLVLPSLLVVWTRFTDVATVPGGDADSDPDAGSGSGSGPESDTDGSNTPETTESD